MNKSGIPKTKPASKFGSKTRNFSVRLPEDLISKIKTEQIDTGRILYDVIEGGVNPYRTKVSTNDIGPGLLRKLVVLMIDNSVSAPAGFFTETEEKAIRNVAMEVMESGT